MDVPEIYESLVVPDIRDAADLLMPTYEKTAGADGYVSLEVSPTLAYDMNETMVEARRLYDLVNRDNLMIKVPATPEGLVAVRELIGSGININVTLIFSLEQYRNVAEAYIEGMEKWVAEGGHPGKVASVASFFVSRVDTMVDERLQEFADPSIKTTVLNLMGKAGIVNAKLAYSLYEELFHGDRFAELKARGVRPQRVLWVYSTDPNRTPITWTTSWDPKRSTPCRLRLCKPIATMDRRFLAFKRVWMRRVICFLGWRPWEYTLTRSWTGSWKMA
jgi:transaldolase/glucose-6-phosphate isomerase